VILRRAAMTLAAVCRLSGRYSVVFLSGINQSRLSFCLSVIIDETWLCSQVGAPNGAVGFKLTSCKEAFGESAAESLFIVSQSERYVPNCSLLPASHTIGERPQPSTLGHRGNSALLPHPLSLYNHSFPPLTADENSRVAARFANTLQQLRGDSVTIIDNGSNVMYARSAGCK
jgi:hypothetical protein